jgi:hypothetical protein
MHLEACTFNLEQFMISIIREEHSFPSLKKGAICKCS